MRHRVISSDQKAVHTHLIKVLFQVLIAELEDQGQLLLGVDHVVKTARVRGGGRRARQRHMRRHLDTGRSA